MTAVMRNLGEEHQKFLLETAVRLDRKLTGKALRQPIFFESFFQLLFNLFGFLLGFAFLKMPPAKISNHITAWIARYQAKNKLAPFLSIADLPPYPHPVSSTGQALLSRGEKEGKRVDPARLILISHPETMGASSYLLGNLIVRAVEIHNTFFPNSKFKFVQAIDHFALDTLSPFLEAFYAGFMAAGHIAMDRQPYKKIFLQRQLFSRVHYTKTIFHILRELKSGSTVCVALAGGVSHNSKILYLFREFAQRIFHSVIPARAGIQKMDIEKQLISSLAQDENSAAVTGKLSQKEKKQLAVLLSSFPLCKGEYKEVEELLTDLEEELSLTTPYRFRFFHILLKRIVAKGKPLLILPLVHTTNEKIVLNKPVLITSYEQGKVKWMSSETSEERMQEEKEFVEEFVNSSFSPHLMESLR